MSGNENETNLPTFEERDNTDSNPESENELPDSDSIGEALDGMESELGDGDLEPSEPSRSNQIRDALRSTEPHTPLQEVESPFDTDNGGLPRIFRGIQKMGGFESSEAWMDILIGMMEWMAQQNSEGSNSSQGESEDEDGLSQDEVEMVTMDE